MHYIAKTSKVQRNKLIQAKQGTQACYVKIIWSALITSPREIMQNTIFLPSPFKNKKKTKTKTAKEEWSQRILR